MLFIKTQKNGILLRKITKNQYLPTIPLFLQLYMNSKIKIWGILGGIIIILSFIGSGYYLKNDLITEQILEYTGPISVSLQECIQNSSASKNTGIVYADYKGDPLLQILTRDKIIQEISPVLGYATNNNQINWSWFPVEQKYIFRVYPGQEPLWACYFKNETNFFKYFLNPTSILYDKEETPTATPSATQTPEPTPSIVPAISFQAPIQESSYFFADGNVQRTESFWGSYTAGNVLFSTLHRHTAFWGDPQGGCLDKTWDITKEIEMNSIYGIFNTNNHFQKVNTPFCNNELYGKSFEGDLYRNGEYTHVLHTESSPNSFLRTHVVNPDKYITGTYTTLMSDWNSSHKLKPWLQGVDEMISLTRVAIITHQSVPLLNIPNNTKQQLQQGIRTVFINEDCNINTSPSYCQLEFNIKTLLAGKNETTPASSANYFADPGQAGLIAVLGPINSEGNGTNLEGYTSWISWGQPTQNQTFMDQKFQIEMTWENFTNTLKTITKNNPVPYFGNNWNKRSSWVLLDIGYGQENYNENPNTETSTIEGFFDNIEVIALGENFVSGIVQMLSNTVEKTSWYQEGDSIVLYADGGFANTPLKIGNSGNIELEYIAGPNRGIADIYVDTVLQESFNMNSPNYGYAKKTISVGSGNKNIKIVRSGNTSGSDKYIVLKSIKTID